MGPTSGSAAWARIVALASGSVLAEGRPEEVQDNDAVIEAYTEFLGVKEDAVTMEDV